MHSFSADPAASHYTAGIRPALIRFVDEFCGTLARLCAYLMTLALLAIVGIGLWNALPDAIDTAPPATAGWSEDARAPRAFAVSQANLHNKTETYEVFRHPGGGRRDMLRWSGADGKPVAELAIYRLGDEPSEASPAAAGLVARMEPNHPREAEAAGVIDSKFGTVALLRAAGDADPARSCLGFIKQIESPALQISGWSCQGDNLPARGAAVGCMLNRLILLNAGNDAKLAEMFAHAELRRSDCPASGAAIPSADWINGAANPRLRGAL